MTARRRTKVLYLHHSGALDGSLVSLRELLRFVDRERFEPVVALLRPGDGVRRELEAIGVPAIRWPGVVAFNHATAFWSDPRRPHTWPPLVETALGWRAAIRNTRRLVDEVRPDVVHVNSVVLAPSADALRRARVPFVWHVREMPEHGVGGLRTRLQRRALLEWPGEAMFLSDAARRAWIGDARGVVVPEPFDPARFSPDVDGRAARRELGLADDAAVILYLGGVSPIKGFEPLVRAMPRVVRQVPSAVCVMPGAASGAASSDSSLVRLGRALGMSTVGERLERAFRESGAAPSCIRLPFSADVPRLMAACDVLAFPATEDHFPRPVVEAGLVERPVVASRLPVIEETVAHGETGLLVPPGAPAALADAIVTLLRDPALRQGMGRAGRRAALRRFDAAASARATMDVYERLRASVL